MPSVLLIFDRALLNREGALEALLKSIIEASERGKACGARHRHYRHGSFNDQSAREIEPVGVGDLFWRPPNFVFKKPAQMPRAHAQSLGKLLLVNMMMKRVVSDEFQCPLNHSLLSPPSR